MGRCENECCCDRGFGGLFGGGCEWIWIIIIILILCPGIFGGCGRRDCCCERERDC